MKVFSAGSRFAQRGLVSHWIPQNWCATSHLLAEWSGARCDLTGSVPALYRSSPYEFERTAGAYEPVTVLPC